MPKLKSIKPLLRARDVSTTPLPRKTKAPVYNSPEFIAFRAGVLRRANYQCEATDQHGRRCTKAQPHYTIIAHHICELADGGSHDLSNGMALCAAHHQHATMKARARRLK